MSNSEPEIALSETLDAAVEDVLRQQIVLQGNVANVQLYATVEDAQTPQEAVERFIQMLVHAGTDTFYFGVTDQESGEHYYVKAGQILDLNEVAAATQDDGED